MKRVFNLTSELVALLVAGACSRSPQAAPWPPHDATPRAAAGDAMASPSKDAATQDAALARAMTGLAGEHERDFGPAM